MNVLFVIHFFMQQYITHLWDLLVGLRGNKFFFIQFFVPKYGQCQKGHHYFRFQNGLSYMFFVMFAIIKLPLCDFLVFFVLYA